MWLTVGSRPVTKFQEIGTGEEGKGTGDERKENHSGSDPTPRFRLP